MGIPYSVAPLSARNDRGSLHDRWIRADQRRGTIEVRGFTILSEAHARRWMREPVIKVFWDPFAVKFVSRRYR
jgi:hypothetical protein